MQIKAFLKALFVSVFLTGLFLLFMAFLLFRLDPGQTPISVGIVLTYVISCFMGGYSIGKSVQKERYLWGLAVGFGYFLLLLLISFAAGKGFHMSVRQLATTFGLCLGGGTLGGMFS